MLKQTHIPSFQSEGRLMIKTPNIFLAHAIQTLAMGRLKGIKPAIYIVDAASFEDRTALLLHLRNVVHYLGPEMVIQVIDDVPEKMMPGTLRPWMLSQDAPLDRWHYVVSRLARMAPNATVVTDFYGSLDQLYFRSPRQFQILKQACGGISPRTIAQSLGLSPCTVYGRLRLSCEYFQKRSLPQLLVHLSQKRVQDVQPGPESPSDHLTGLVGVPYTVRCQASSG